MLANKQAKEWMQENYPLIGVYNHEQTASQELLQKCFPDAALSLIVAGLLAHCHLLLVLLSIKYGNKWQRKEDDQRYSDRPAPWNADGCLDSEKMVKDDAQLGILLDHGLEVQMLSWKIYVENPEACAIISDAMNSGNSLALAKTTVAMVSELTMTVSRLVNTENMNETYIKSQLSTTSPQLAHSQNFKEWMNLVIVLGHTHNSYLPQFFAFASECIDSKHRQLRLEAARPVQSICAYPRSTIAFLKRSLLSTPSNGICPAPPSNLKEYPVVVL